MSGELIYAEFGNSCNLYDVLGVAKTASDKDITRAYRKLALKYHPDKHRGDDASKAKTTTKFQALSAIHALLSNVESRALYDETGTVPSSDSVDTTAPSYQMWVEYFARMFPKVTERDIATFSDSYRLSDEEQRDVLAEYTKGKGNMQRILDSVMLSTDDDEPRFAAMITAAIARGDVKEWPQWRTYMTKQATKATKSDKQTDAQRKRAAAKRAKEAEEADALMQQIRNKQHARAAGAAVTALSAKRERGFDSLIASLETRYAEKPGRKSTKRSKKEDDNEPSDEAFAAAQKRLTQRKTRK